MRMICIAHTSRVLRMHVLNQFQVQCARDVFGPSNLLASLRAHMATDLINKVVPRGRRLAYFEHLFRVLTGWTCVHGTRDLSL